MRHDLRVNGASQIEELRRHIRVILADSGVIDKVLATPFEIAIGSSGTIESIEQMIHHTVTTPTDSQVSAGGSKLLWRSKFICIFM